MTPGAHEPHASAPMPPWQEYALLLLILAIATLLRCWNLASESAWYDEVLILPALHADTLRGFWALCPSEDSVPQLSPVHPVAAFVWSRAFGPGLIASRMLSLCCGCLSLLLVHALGRRLYGPRAGLVAAGVVALSMPPIFFSQEVRRYALEGLIVLASFASLYWAMSPTRVRPIRLGLHTCCNAIMLWTSPFTLAVLPAQALLWWLRRPRSYRAATAWLLVHAALVMALLTYLVAMQRDSMYWLLPPGWRELLNTFVVYAGGRFSNDDPSPYLPWNFSLDLPLAVLLCGTPLLLLAQAVRARRESPALATHLPLLLWLLFPACFWFTAALVYKPFYMYRWIAFGAFPLALFAGAAACALPRKARMAYLVVLFSLLLWQDLAVFKTPFRPDYQVAVARIAAGPSEQPLLVLKKSLNGMPLHYAGFPENRSLTYAYGEGDLHAESIALAERYGKTWVLLWRWDRMPAYEAALAGAGLTLTTQELGGMPPLILGEVAPRAPL